MRQKSVQAESPSERLVKNIRRVTRKRHSAEEKIRIVLDGLRGESSIAELCRREGIAESRGRDQLGRDKAAPGSL
jgi:transposase